MKIIFDINGEPIVVDTEALELNDANNDNRRLTIVSISVDVTHYDVNDMEENMGEYQEVEPIKKLYEPTQLFFPKSGP